MKLSNRLATLRDHSGKTQEQVIDEITAMLGGRRPFNRTMLSHWERGRHQPAGEALAILCQYYRVGPGDILVLHSEHAPLAA
jgi:transcriptional regulator with XRE-family HTH domain